MSCAEVSVWTKYCEIDLLRSTKEFLRDEISHDRAIVVPVDVSRYEAHLSRPLKTHNIGKKRNEIVKEMKRSMTTKRRMEKDDANGTISSILEHDYAEDVIMTLADVVVFVNIRLIFHRALFSLHSGQIPALRRVSEWYQRMAADNDVVTAAVRCGLTEFGRMEHGNCQLTITVPSVPFESLYIRDPNRYNPTPRVYTKQTELEAVMKRLKDLSIEPKRCQMTNFTKSVVNWNELPLAVHPRFGDLPMSRLQRKCQQLENMANAICGIASDGDTIVDFCSGGGHLGILLAHLLPECNIIMIENKESSVARAVLRAKTLPNVTVYQGNLDYFKGSLDVGVALHACGVATDLVLQRCIEVGASFIVCPCCYGGVRDTHVLSYPRSERFRCSGITSEEYYFLGHSADQTHENGHKEEQGKLCMRLVDTDRLYEAEAVGYDVQLLTMNPVNCTPKNNMLVGVNRDKRPVGSALNVT